MIILGFISGLIGLTTIAIGLGYLWVSLRFLKKEA